MTLLEDRQRVRTQLKVNMVVEAGAGTGKTTLLIERLCLALLAQGIPAPRLVALTFTEKAAAEIKTRLIFQLHRIVRAIEQEQKDPVLHTLQAVFAVPEEEILQRASQALEQLDRSQIGTIHSFCADILRMYPLEAGLTPNAEIDKGTRAQHIFDTQWNRFLDKELGLHAPREQAWMEVLQQVSLRDLYVCAQEMCSGKMVDPSYQMRQEVLVPILEQRAKTARQLAEMFLKNPEKPRVIERALAQAVRRFEQAIVWLQNGQLPAQPEETIEVKSVPADWDGPVAEQAKALCRFAAQVDPYVQRLVQKAYQLLEGLVKDIRRRYEQEGILSFDDLIVKTRNLLRENLLVRRLLQEKYDAFYIDEFQDTDPVQGELLLFLAEQKGTGATRWQDVKLEPGKLFVVGDPKQSIYRFRGADITAYQMFTDLILAQGGEKAYLRRNFRSEQGIIALANQVGSVAMQQKPHFQPKYEAIFTDKQAGAQTAQLVLIKTPLAKALSDDYRHNQAEWVARWIEENVGKMPLKNGKVLQYADIAILSRAATTLGPYTEALRRWGVPFAIEEDRDFYRRQEVADFLNLLRCIEDPNNRIALVGVLRSPLGGLTDEEIYQAAQCKQLNFAQTVSSPKLVRIYELLRSLRKKAGHLPLHQLLRYILQHTFLAEACACAYDGERSLSNLERLVALAEGYSLKRPTTLGQFLARVQTLMEQELSQLTAMPEGENTRAVHVMTIHKSKGLEFPVVILVDISKRETAVAINRPTHLYSWPYQLHGLRVGKYADMHLAWLEEEQREHARCEEVRVLYVALTRAREKLLIVGNQSSEAGTWAALFAKAGCFPEQGQPELLGDENQLQVIYQTYQKPADFIYTHHQTTRQTPLAAVDLSAWKQTHQLRQQAYEKALHQPVPSAPSALTAKPGEAKHALQLGSWVHAALARRYLYPQENMKEALVATAEEVTSAQQQEALEILTCFEKSAVYRKITAMESLAVEIPFSLQTSQGVVNGIIDALLRDKNSTIWVVDYKTDQVPAGREAIAAQSYQPQIEVYIQAVQKMYPQTTVRGAIVFVRSAAWVELPASGNES